MQGGSTSLPAQGKDVSMNHCIVKLMLIGCLCSMITLSSLWAFTHTVKQDGSGNFINIQDAIVAASNADTILVYPGVYVENVDFIGKALTVNSLEALEGDRSYVHRTIIDGNRTNPCVSFINGVLEATLRGFTLRNGMGSFRSGDELEARGGGVLILQTGRVNLTNCDITSNVAALGAGVYSKGGHLYLSGVNIFENQSVYSGAGLEICADVQQNTSITFDPDNLCSIYSNYGQSPVDIVIVQLLADVEINLDLFTIAQPTDFYIGRIMNHLEYFDYTDTINIQRGLRSEVNHDLYVSPTGNDANSGLSPSQAMKSITKALHHIEADSLDIKTVHVLPGIYREAADGQIFPLPLKSNVNLIGAGSEQTILIADSALPPMVSIMIASQELKNSSIKGFTLLSENEDRNFPFVLFKRSTNVKVSDIVIRDMKVIDWGAFNFMDWNSSEIDSLVLENITTDEIAFYAMNIESGSISNCRFENINSLYTTDDPVFTGRGMIDIWFSGTLSMDNCEFRDLSVVNNQPIFHVSNISYYIGEQSEVNITNCLFAGLRTNAQSPIAFFTEDLGTYKVSNCTFYDNYGAYAAVAISGHMSMRNNIFFNPDAPKEIHIYHVPPVEMYYSKLDFDYNLIRGGYSSINKPGNLSILLWGEHNLDQEPAFTSTELSDPFFLHLSSESLCIDAGTPDISLLDLPPYDLANNWRVWNGRIDMGCFEYGSQPWVSIDDPVAPVLPESSITAYPNPFSGFTSIKVRSLGSQSVRDDRLDRADITIYNIKGQRVKSISLDPATVSEQVTYWDGRGADNIKCASGIYFINLRVNGKRIDSKKVTFIR